MEVDESCKERKEQITLAYTLSSDLKQMTHLWQVFEEKVLDSHVDLTLRELLSISKKELHDIIMDLIKKKRKQSDEEDVGDGRLLKRG